MHGSDRWWMGLQFDRRSFSRTATGSVSAGFKVVQFPVIMAARQKSLSVHEILNILEEEDFESASIILTPPDETVSEGDSGDEEGGGIDNLSGRQLRATAEASLVRLDQTKEEIRSSNDAERVESPAGPSAPSNEASGGRITEGQEAESSVSNYVTSVGKKRTSSRVESDLSRKKQRKWVSKDLPEAKRRAFDWAGPEHNPANESALSPTQQFERFFDDELINLLITETERYAGQKGRHDFRLTQEEFRVFIAILLTTGHAPLPRRRMYWEMSDDCHNKAISSAMARNRFDEILQFLHIADNTQLPSTDKFSKVRPLFDTMNDRCLKAFKPQQNLSIDESMVPYFGRHSGKQFIRGKPVRFGYKIWCLATPDGRLVQMQPYQGKGPGGANIAGLGLGGSVVLELLAPLPGLDTYHYRIYMDSFFTSPALVDHLTQMQVGITGTVRANRTDRCPLPTTEQLSKQERGTMSCKYDQLGGAVAVRWHDNSVVTIMSNCEGVTPRQEVSRWSRKHKKFVDIPQPAAISAYNKGMGGVDRLDQNIACYRMSARMRKWWWPLFAYVVDLAVQNAWLLHRQALSPSMTMLEFRREICLVYFRRAAAAAPARPRPAAVQRSRVPADIRYDRLDHLIEYRGSASRCAASGCNGRSQYVCQKCRVGLHPQCFARFHQTGFD